MKQTPVFYSWDIPDGLQGAALRTQAPPEDVGTQGDIFLSVSAEAHTQVAYLRSIFRAPGGGLHGASFTPT